MGEGDAPAQERLLLVWHADHGRCQLPLPPGDWVLLLNSAHAQVLLPGEAADTVNGPLALHEASVWVLVQGLRVSDATQ